MVYRQGKIFYLVRGAVTVAILRRDDHGDVLAGAGAVHPLLPPTDNLVPWFTINPFLIRYVLKAVHRILIIEEDRKFAPLP